MSPALAEALAELPGLAREHLLLSLAAVALGCAVGLPLALWGARSARVRVPALGLAGLVQTVPALALLALFYPMLLVLGRVTGWNVPALGFLPALIALSLYAVLPILRNGIAALQGVDPAVLEAADGVGMTRRQRLVLVELPLGAPVILAGVRTACVWTIGAATLATTVGQPSLGNLIFSGLQTENWVRVLVGCVAAAGLALAADGVLALVESGVRGRKRGRVWVGGGVLIAAVLFALGFAREGPSTALGTNGENIRGRAIVVGAKNFSEQYILASAIEGRLRAAGYRTERRDDLGSAVAYRAVAAGDVHVYVDYSGTLWTNVLGRTDMVPAARMRSAVAEGLKKRDGVTVLGALGFENAYALAMRRERAAALGVRDLGDLARVAPRLAFGSDIEFLSRPEWRAVERAYGLRFGSRRNYTPTFMYRAVADGSADVISAFSSDGRIAALDLVVLGDPKGALPSYDALVLLSPAMAKEEGAVAALRPLIGAIPVERMRAANLMVDRDVGKRTPREAAEFLLGD